MYLRCVLLSHARASRYDQTLAESARLQAEEDDLDFRASTTEPDLDAVRGHSNRHLARLRSAPPQRAIVACACGVSRREQSAYLHLVNTDSPHRALIAGGLRTEPAHETRRHHA